LFGYVIFGLLDFGFVLHILPIREYVIIGDRIQETGEGIREVRIEKWSYG